VIGELVASVVCDESAGVDKPEAALGLLLCETLVHEELNQLLSNTNTSRTGTEEYGTLISCGDA